MGLDGFIDDMREQGIHVGINGRCAVDGEAWPCTTERRPKPPFVAPDGHRWEAAEGKDDRLANDDERALKRCRRMRCPHPVAWALWRANRSALSGGSWWLYCAEGDHTYGRWIEADADGVEHLLHWRLVDR